MRTASDKIYRFIKDYEKFRGKLYDKDGASKTTIGYGHLVHHGKLGTNPSKEKDFLKGITEGYALELLKQDVKSKAEININRYVKVALTQNQFDALVSLTFNIGPGNFRYSSLLAKINENKMDTETITKCFIMWNKVKQDGRKVVSPGLMKRRRQEANIFNNSVYVSAH